MTVHVLSITGGENVVTQCHLGRWCIARLPPINHRKLADWTTEHSFRSQLHKIVFKRESLAKPDIKFGVQPKPMQRRSLESTGNFQ